MCRPAGTHFRLPSGAIANPPPPNLLGHLVYGKQKECPLTAVAADVMINDFTASVTITQQFENKESNPIEAVYQVCGYQSLPR